MQAFQLLPMVSDSAISQVRYSWVRLSLACSCRNQPTSSNLTLPWTSPSLRFWWIATWQKIQSRASQPPACPPCSTQTACIPFSFYMIVESTKISRLGSSWTQMSKLMPCRPILSTQSVHSWLAGVETATTGWHGERYSKKQWTKRTRYSKMWCTDRCYRAL